MQNLQPLEAYTDDVAALWNRQRWAVGLAFGTVMAIATPWIAQSVDSAGAGATATLMASVVAFVVGGLLVGSLWSLTMARSMTAMTRAVYTGSSPFDVDVPSGDYEYRLPASLRISDRHAVGGVLFLGRRALTFVPHRLNLPAHRSPLVIVVGADFNIELVPQRMTAFRRLVVGTLPRLAKVTHESTSWLFLLPRPEDTVHKMRNVLFASECEEEP